METTATTMPTARTAAACNPMARSETALAMASSLGSMNTWASGAASATWARSSSSVVPGATRSSMYSPPAGSKYEAPATSWR